MREFNGSNWIEVNSNSWIKVSERLPEVDNTRNTFGDLVKCLVVYEGFVYLGFFQNFGAPHWSIRHISSRQSLPITHWMPLPEPPKED